MGLTNALDDENVRYCKGMVIYDYDKILRHCALDMTVESGDVVLCGRRVEDGTRRRRENTYCREEETEAEREIWERKNFVGENSILCQ